MTRFFLGLCVLVFAVCIASDRALPLFRDSFALSTMLRFGAIAGTLGAAQPWRYLAAVFVHFNVMHLAMNGWTLSVVARSAERELGRARFAILFVLSGILGFVASDLWFGGVSPQTAGASGAVFGVFGALIGIAYARRDPNWKQILIQNLVWIAILSLMGNVNNAAHAGGLVTGAVLGFLFNREPRGLKLNTLFGIAAGVLLALCVASVALSAASPVWRLVRGQEQSLQQ